MLHACIQKFDVTICKIFESLKELNTPICPCFCNMLSLTCFIIDQQKDTVFRSSPVSQQTMDLLFIYLCIFILFYFCEEVRNSALCMHFSDKISYYVLVYFHIALRDVPQLALLFWGPTKTWSSFR
jgi:hypothetical protein